ncbi:MAG TPA: site-2 protease family protein, partial [Mycobacteriales bacterium]|nr:site-2 protease family protein [Mycobacteriales bacterium]
MSYTLGVLFFVIALLVSVMLHEAGHFLTARSFGMKASRFFVGFGPTLWSTHRGETEYGVKAIPAGGFVKIVGMTDLEEIEPGDEDRAFFRQPAPQKLVVLSAGSIVHFIIAIVLLYLVLATTGDILKAEPTLRIDSISSCVPRNLDTGECTSTSPKAPAVGKLKPNDVVVAVNGQQVSSYDQMRSVLRASPGQPVSLTVRRDGSLVPVEVTPAPVKQGGQTIGFIGVSPVQRQKPLSVLGAVPRTFTTLGDMTVQTGRALGDLPHQISEILHGQPRPATGAASVVDIARVSGQIAQAKVSFGERRANLVAIVAELNFFVGVFNLLPLLPLDGGHVAILVFEEIRSRLYRLVGRRDPGRVDLMKV